MSVSSQPEIDLAVTPSAGVEVKKFMDAEGVTAEQGGLRVSVQPGGCSGFKYSLVIEDRAAEVIDVRALHAQDDRVRVEQAVERAEVDAIREADARTPRQGARPSAARHPVVGEPRPDGRARCAYDWLRLLLGRTFPPR